MKLTSSTPKPPGASATVAAPFVSKKGNLEALVGGLSKKPKLNTLEKSKQDWQLFVAKEDIADELQHHNKDGLVSHLVPGRFCLSDLFGSYLEKVAFLQRSEERKDAFLKDIRSKDKK